METNPHSHGLMHRRAGAYLLVLGTAMMVSVVGLAAITSARIELRATQDGASSSSARSYARSAIELALIELRDNDAWRTTYKNGAWVRDVAIGGGTYSIVGVDPTDGSLSDGPLDPLLLTGIGESGGARHMVQVSLTAEVRPLNALECALYAAGALTIQTCHVHGNGLIGSAVSVISGGADVEVDVESAGSILGGDYEGDVSSGAAPRMVPSSDSVFDYYTSNGVLIDFAELLDPRQNLLSNSGMENGTTDWYPADGAAVLESVSGPVKSGVASLHTFERSNASAGPTQTVVTKIKNSGQWILRAWVHPLVPPGTNTFKLKLTVTTNLGVQNFYAAQVTAGPGWNLVQGRVNAIFTGNLSSSEYCIETVGSTDEFWTDDVGLYDAAHIRGIFGAVLSPAANPYGAQQLNADGIYVIDCGGNGVTIDSCRIVGTLVFINASAGVKVTNLVNWAPAVAAWPSLMVDGPLTIELSDSELKEPDLNINFNPPGTPYADASDSDVTDVYPSIMKGLIYASGAILIQNKTHIEGVELGAGTITLAKDELIIQHASQYDAAMPPGFEGASAMHLVKDSWRKVVE